MDYPFRAYMPAGPIGANATISIVVPRPQSREGRMADPFFFELLAGIGDAARERGCDILLSYIAPSSYDELATAMSTSRSDGVIFLGQSTLHEAFNRLAEVEDRFVVLEEDVTHALVRRKFQRVVEEIGFAGTHHLFLLSRKSRRRVA